MRGNDPPSEKDTGALKPTARKHEVDAITLRDAAAIDSRLEKAETRTRLVIPDYLMTVSQADTSASLPGIPVGLVPPRAIALFSQDHPSPRRSPDQQPPPADPLAVQWTAGRCPLARQRADPCGNPAA